MASNTSPQMTMPPTNHYHLDIPGLSETIASCPVDEKHRELLRRVRSLDMLHAARLATTRSGSFLVKRKVLAADGTLVHDDHEKWLRLQLDADGGNAAATRTRLRAGNYQLTRCALTTLFIVHDRHGPSETDFVQIEVEVEDEWVECRLFKARSWLRDEDMRDLRDLLDECEGDTLQDDARRRLRPAAYCLGRVIDVAAFVDEIDAVEAQHRVALRKRRVLVTDMATHEERLMSHDELSPGWDRHPSKVRRLFEDWRQSSAGRSGARLCEQWVVQTGDYTDKDGERWLSLIPAWTFNQALAKVTGDQGSVYELFGKLEKLDRRVRVPFSWYFYMLHGNKVDDAAARRILKGAEDGLIVLPEHDYQVLAAWETQRYGF